MRKREKQILIRVSDEELEMINRNTRNQNLSRSDYRRKLANNFDPSSSNIEYITKYEEDFKMLGNIFHKLARQANFYGYIDDKTYKKYATYLFKILDDIKYNLNIK